MFDDISSIQQAIKPQVDDTTIQNYFEVNAVPNITVSLSDLQSSKAAATDSKESQIKEECKLPTAEWTMDVPKIQFHIDNAGMDSDE